MTDRIPIVVVPRDRFSILPRCLDAIYANTAPGFRVIVVAGGIDAETRAYLSRLQGEKDNLSIVLTDHLLMQGESRNLGLRLVDERYCVMLENDTVVGPGWLAPMLECMRETNAAAVMPLIDWYRGIHAAGCMFVERTEGGVTTFGHRIVYSGLERKRIDYAECHCILMNRELLPDDDLFEDVEPFDVDLGLTLRERGLSSFLEPRARVTYVPPPPLEVRDVPPFRFRWDPVAWEARNQEFMRKWKVVYNAAPKVASYRRQQLKLGLARWYPSRLTVGLSNLGFRLTNRLLARVAAPPRPGETSTRADPYVASR